jgi:enamine deaminase RidA (YjgF/YER057c/UK114 family)
LGAASGDAKSRELPRVDRRTGTHLDRRIAKMKRQFLWPKDMWARVENGNLLYTPVVTVHGADHAHVYLSGQLAREPDGTVVGQGDMRAQLRKTCQNIETGLAYVGATFDDVVRSTTYVTDVDEYYRCSDERFKFFRNRRPTSVLVPVIRLGLAEAMVEIEVEAILEPERLIAREERPLR